MNTEIESHQGRDSKYYRELLLMVIDPEIQQLLHDLDAARTPEEWVQRERLITPRLVELSKRQSGKSVEGGGWELREVYCPICRRGMRRGQGILDQFWHLERHLEGELDDPCLVLAELRERANALRQDHFADDSIRAARARYEPDKRGRGARRRGTGQPPATAGAG